MQVDSASTPAPTTEGEEKEKETAKVSSKPKYTAPVDGQTEDLILEGTAYLRLLLVLMNLDAGKVEEVSQLDDLRLELTCRLPNSVMRLQRFWLLPTEDRWTRFRQRSTFTSLWPMSA